MTVYLLVDIRWLSQKRILLEHSSTSCIPCVCVRPQSLQFYLTLCNPMECSPPGSSVHGIFQARILEWGMISYSRGSSQPRDPTCISWNSRWILYHKHLLGSASFSPYFRWMFENCLPLSNNSISSTKLHGKWNYFNLIHCFVPSK